MKKLLLLLLLAQAPQADRLSTQNPFTLSQSDVESMVGKAYLQVAISEKQIAELSKENRELKERLAAACPAK